MSLSSARTTPSLAVKSTLAETIGSEVIVHVAAKHGRFLIKAPRDDAPAPGDRVGLNFNNRSVHAFDAEGRRM